MLAILRKQTCRPNDLTIRHLERKLKRYERRVHRSNAKPSDYVNYDRLATQLAEAKTYLC